MEHALADRKAFRLARAASVLLPPGQASARAPFVPRWIRARQPIGSARVMLETCTMDNTDVMSDMVRKSERGRGKRVTVAVAAAVLVAALVGVVAVGFRGRHISRNAAAMVTPVAASGNVAAKHAAPAAPPSAAPAP